MARQFLSDKNGWLSFNHTTPVLYITAEDEDGKAYVNTLHKLGDGMGIGERYAVVGI